MAKTRRFNEEKAEAWYQRYPNYYIWFLNPAFCDEVELPEGEEAEAILDADYERRLKLAKPGEAVERYSSVKKMWADEDRAKLREWCIPRSRVVRLFNQQKAEEWLTKNPGKFLFFDNPKFYDFKDKSKFDRDVVGLEEELDKLNRAEYNSWRNELNHTEEITIALKDDEEIPVIELIVDPNAFVDKDDVLEEIRIVLKDHPSWYDLVISIEYLGMTATAYAEEHGKERSGVTKMLHRALDYLRKNFK